MDKVKIGQNFWDLMQDLGENYYLQTPYGDEWQGKMSLEIKTSSTYMLSERELLYQGTATFPYESARNEFRGCYFVRDTEPEKTFLLVSTIPEPTDYRIADVYVVKCNTTVNLAYLELGYDDKHNRVQIPHVYQEDVKAFFDSTLQKQRRSDDGNFEQTLFYMQIPAKYGVKPDDCVIRLLPQHGDKTGEVTMVETKFRVESVDNSLTDVDEFGNIYGIVDVQMSLDTRL